jgi:hypothetical protein
MIEELIRGVRFLGTWKDQLTLLLSGVAAIISIVTFWLTYIQRRKEDRRALRRSLTDVISELNEVNVAFAKLEIENPHSADDLILNLRSNILTRDGSLPMRPSSSMKRSRSLSPISMH